jgi:hypothetical protein
VVGTRGIVMADNTAAVNARNLPGRRRGW